MKKIYACSSGCYSDKRYTKIFVNEDDAKKYEKYCGTIHSDDCENGYQELDLLESFDEHYGIAKQYIKFTFDLRTNNVIGHSSNEMYGYHKKYEVYQNEATIRIELTNKPLENHEKIARDYYFILKEAIKDYEIGDYAIYSVVDRLNWDNKEKSK